MRIGTEILNRPIAAVLEGFPYAGDFFLAAGIGGLSPRPETVQAFLDGLDEGLLEDVGSTPAELGQNFVAFLNRMEGLKRQTGTVSEITILGGRDKLGRPEDLSITIRRGEVITVLGPTGSGKSRLLGDIECLAQGDTQTRRRVLIDGRVPTPEERFRIENKLIAQLTQNMNFVMDLPVMDFLRLHGESRMIQDVEGVTRRIFEAANDLAGEQFLPTTPLTQLSGGQSRALMIADTAFLSLSPVVLIDEIENAGVDRKKALGLLVREQKIVLMSTHDPILALMGDKRIIIENGGIKALLETSAGERENLAVLEELDRKHTRLLHLLRSGERAEIPFADL